MSFVLRLHATWLEVNVQKVTALPLSRCRTIALETGFQNSQLCSTIIQLSFSFEELELMFAFPLIYSIFQLVVAIIFVGGKSPTRFSSSAGSSEGPDRYARINSINLQVYDRPKQPRQIFQLQFKDNEFIGNKRGDKEL